jgi:hypothetical protein
MGGFVWQPVQMAAHPEQDHHRSQVGSLLVDQQQQFEGLSERLRFYEHVVGAVSVAEASNVVSGDVL